MQRISSENLIAVAITMALAAGIPAMLPRLPLPGVVLKIVLGAIIGPQILGLVHPGTTLNFIANFALAMLFLMAGCEMDPAVLQERPICNALAGWGISAITTLSAATLLTTILYPAIARRFDHELVRAAPLSAG